MRASPGTTASLAGIEAGDAGGVDRVAARARDRDVDRRRPAAVPRRRGRAAERLLVRSTTRRRRATAAGCTGRARPAERYAAAADAATDAGRVYSGLTALIRARQATPEFAGGELIGFDARHPSVLAYQRPGADAVILVLANVGDDLALIDPLTLSGFGRRATDVVTGVGIDLGRGIALQPHGFRVAASHTGRLSGGSRAVTPTPERRLGRSLSRPGAAPA